MAQRFKLTPKYPTESQEQRSLIKWARMRSATMPELNMLVSMPLGGKRDLITGAIMKAEGAKKGFPDLALFVRRGNSGALFIELKRRAGGRASTEQADWLDRLTAQGYRATVCYGWDDARQVIEAYLAQGKA